MYSGNKQASGIMLSRRDKTYIDISLAWEPNPLNGDITTLRDVRAINNSLKNIVMTTPLETPFNANFCSQVNSLLFDPVDLATAGILELEIRRAIEGDEKRVKVENVFVKPNSDGLSFVVDIEYKIIGSEEIFSVKQILTATR